MKTLLFIIACELAFIAGMFLHALENEKVLASRLDDDLKYSHGTALTSGYYSFGNSSASIAIDANGNRTVTMTATPVK